MTNRKIQEFVSELTVFCKKQPFFFYDIVKEFETVPYQDILIAWGILRENIAFKRDEDGRYFYLENE